jgi:uncharacterized protein (UPF0332 family)
MSKRGKKKLLPSLMPIRRHYGKNILQAYMIDCPADSGMIYTFEDFARKHGVSQKQYANYFNRKFDYEKRSNRDEFWWISEREDLLLSVWLHGAEGKIHFGEFLLRMAEVSNTEMEAALEHHGELLDNEQDTSQSLLFQLVQRKIYDKRNRDYSRHSEALARTSRRDNPPDLSREGRSDKRYDRRAIKNPTKGQLTRKLR